MRGRLLGDRFGDGLDTGFLAERPQHGHLVVLLHYPAPQGQVIDSLQ